MQELTSENIKELPILTGVYRIWVRGTNNNPLQLQRLCGVDNTGLLYIGRTKDQTLRKRIYQFYASAHLDMNTHNHSGALKYFKREVIRTFWGQHSLWFDYEVTNTPKEKENELLSQYALMFGEYPPLNK